MMPSTVSNIIKIIIVFFFMKTKQFGNKKAFRFDDLRD